MTHDSNLSPEHLRGREESLAPRAAQLTLCEYRFNIKNKVEICIERKMQRCLRVYFFNFFKVYKEKSECVQFVSVQVSVRDVAAKSGCIKIGPRLAFTSIWRPELQLKKNQIGPFLPVRAPVLPSKTSCLLPADPHPFQQLVAMAISLARPRLQSWAKCVHCYIWETSFPVSCADVGVMAEPHKSP